LRYLPLAAALAVAPALAQIGEYAGPSILSRGGGGGVAPVSAIAIRPYINLSGIYTSGLLTGGVRPDGTVDSENAYGAEAAVGLYGYRGWKRTVLGVNYRGDYRRYSKRSPYDGTNQFFTLGLTHNPSKHLSITLREGAGTFTQNFAYGGTFGFYDPAFAHIPQDELVDSRTNYATTMADVTYLKSARLSFNFGATGFVVRRQRSSLYSVVGATARTDAAYRLSRRSTVAVDYFFTHYGYSRAFGTGDIHSVAADYSVQLTRWWQAGFRAGVMGVESLYLGVVNVDPLVSAITGQTHGVRAAYNRVIQPTYSAQLTRQLRRATAAISYTHGANPGNGVYLASRQNSASASFTYTGMRRWSLFSSFTYSDMQSLGQQIGRYESVGGSFGATRSISQRNLYLTARADVRRTLVEQGFSKTYSSFSVGLAYSPGDIPLRLW
jgi:hypothetical protein